MHGSCNGWIAAVSIVTLLSLPSQVLAQRATPQAVQNAIDRSTNFLLSNQLPEGGWPEFSPINPMGVTSLVTLALLNAGVDPEKREMARALNYLAGAQLERTYTVSLQTMALCAANPNRYAAQIQSNAQWLVDAQCASGGWDYDSNSKVVGDPSNSQFALLALHEAQRAGVKLPPEQWKKTFESAGEYWKQFQSADGGFPYSVGERSRGSMTAAGIASLIIAGSQADDLEAQVTDTIRCCGSGKDDRDRISAGLQWLGQNFSVTSNPGFNSYHLYYIYGLERAGRLTGQRFIGGHDWYREGCEHLMTLQDQITGKIVPAGRAYQGNEYTETAFSLLFLAKGKRQIVVSRLKFGESQDWNHHATAIRNLTAHTEQAWKRDLAWQSIDLGQAKVEDLLESPVLFISGTQNPQFSDEAKRKLKDYVEQGGFVFIEACNGDGCNGAQFHQAVQRLAVEVFGQPLEKLPPDHPIWFAQSRIAPADLPKDMWLYGVQSCCRLGVVYCPVSLSCRWELNLPYGNQPDYPDKVRRELDTVTKLGMNVLAYATGRELKDKLDTVTILEDAAPTTSTDRGVFFLPVLRHNASYDAAPRAIPTLMQWIDKEIPFELSSEKRTISITPDELRQYPIVFMHGQGELQLSNDQRDALKKYLEDGGFLFADSICADEAFTRSFRAEMERITGQRLVEIPETHPMLSNKFYGTDIRNVSVISSDNRGDSIESAIRRTVPQLETILIDSRIAVVFSPLDISCALESRHSLQCKGYTRDDAAKIGINVLLFGLQQ